MAKYQLIGDQYQLTRRVLAGDAKRGVPELWQATSYGDLHYIRVWPRTSQNDLELKALWNREVRSLMRLHGYPGASSLFVRLQDLGVTNERYYAVLAGGEYQLLRQVLDDRPRYRWLQNLGEVSRRRPLWEGMLRIAEALSILHSEGTLHRSLNTASVFCGPDGRGEFRLSGFEWSLRIAGRDGAAARVGATPTLQAKELDSSEGEYSVATDWFDFGLITAELFGVTVRGVKKREIVRGAVERANNLRDGEKEFILELLEDDPELRVASGQAVTERIRAIVRDLNAVTANPSRALVLAFRIEPGASLSQAIERASTGTAKASDPIAQRDWLQRDLRGDLRVIARSTPEQHFIVRGAQLSYKVRAWSVNGLSTWEVGFCDMVEAVPTATSDDQILGLQSRQIEVVLYPYARKHFTALRDKSSPWDKAFPLRSKPPQLDSGLADVWDFFRITQQIDAVLTAAQICPVRVLDTERTPSETFIVVSPFEDTARNELAQHLMLGPPSEQLKEWVGLGAEPIIMDDEDQPSKDKWTFLERRAIGNDTKPTQTWKLVRAEPHKAGPRYTFRAEGAPPIKGPNLYLARNYGGTIRQLRRRGKAIEDLRSHQGLLRVLADPSGASRRGHDQVPAGERDIKLDDSKRNALAALWEIQPSFALQGPPGTGKTTLIKAFADRLLTEDPSAQILITAHSHHTVDDVLGKLVDLFNEPQDVNRPIILRLGVDEDNEQSVQAVTERILVGMSDSELLAKAPTHLKDRYLNAVLGEKSDEVSLEYRAMQTLVQDAANITCSTSNDAQLAEMATRGRRFDWSIVEEAAKAHGFDMALALQQSHRLVLIGDHKQLPPFNSRIFRDILGDVNRVRRAIQIGVQFAPGLVDSAIIDEGEERDSLEERCGRWRGLVSFFGAFFDQSDGGGGVRPAATLTDQHRMHPHIAELVGRVFYPDGNGGTILRSPEETIDRFKAPPPYRIRSNSVITDERIIWCDVPYVQKDEWAEGEKDGLFVSVPEVESVVEVLKALEAEDGQPCDVQILSPYNDQLDELRGELERRRLDGTLSHMFEPPFSLQEGKRMGATVDEFQGSEADIVVVSLVRNNGLAPWKSVGFLKEANRLNVLLSRARHKLIIVGSWDFFASRCNEHTAPDAEYAFLGPMMDEMRAAERAGKLRRVSVVQ
jgi:serine/threonine protein kinase